MTTEHPPLHRKPWTAPDDRRLLALYEREANNPRGISAIAAALGRTHSAIVNRANKLGIHRTGDGKHILTATQIAATLGLANSTVANWMKGGKLGRKYRRAGHGLAAIEVDDLWKWMEQPCSWNSWECEHLRDLAWRQHFTDVRAGWVNSNEAAQLLCVQPGTLLMWRRKGWLPFVRTPHLTWYRRVDVEAAGMRRLEQTQ